VTLIAESDARIRYTTDGSEPNDGSPDYSGPLYIWATATATTVKAQAYRQKDGVKAPSFTVSMVVTIVPFVTEVRLAPYYSTLDQNPGPGGGLRIFPDLPSRDFDNRSKPQDLVRVIVQVSQAQSTLVYLQAIDVDDPSDEDDAWSKATDLDANGPAGNDNRGRTKRTSGTGVWPGNRIAIRTGTNGLGGTEFAVSLQPGDNYVFVATTVPELLPAFPLPYAGRTILDATNVIAPNENMQTTPMLTVWRRLFVEIDRMDNVNGNSVRGTIKAARVNPLSVSTTLDVGLQFPKGVENRFMSGKITVDGIGALQVLASSNNSRGDDTVLVPGDISQAVGKAYVLVDDDVKDDYGDGARLPMPNFNALIVPFAQAYIVPQLLTRSNSDQTANFVLNYQKEDETYIRSLYSFQNRHTPSDNWWAVYVLSAFQFLVGQDNDPDRNLADYLLGVIPFVDNPPTVLGKVDKVGGEGASLFWATIADDHRSKRLPKHFSSGHFCDGDDDIFVHEVGHLMKAVHEDFGIMGNGISCMPVFSMKSLAKIRGVEFH
jgi:hypothetical protein